MSNLNNVNSPLPPASGITVQYCGNIAPDDFMWSVACDVTDLFDMIKNPVGWIYDLSQLVDWRSPNNPLVPAPPAVLLSNFEVRIAIRKDIGDDRILIQGISETGIVRVSAAGGAAREALKHVFEIEKPELLEVDVISGEVGASPATVPSDDWLQQYWRIFLTALTNDDSEMNTFVDGTDQSWFGHCRIYDPKWEWVAQLLNIYPNIRPMWIGCFLLVSTYDPTGYASCVSQMASQLNPGDPSPMPVAYSVQDSTAFSYAGQEGSEEECCDAIYGHTDASGALVITNSIVKNYKVPVLP